MQQKPRGETQALILEYIKAEIQEKSYPPSVREIAAAVGLKSTSTVHGHLRRLEEKGLLHRDTMKPRAMEVTGAAGFTRNTTAAVPVLGLIQDDVPLFDEQNYEDYIPLPQVLLDRGQHFVIRVRDDLLKDTDDIRKGDYLIVKQTATTGAGELAAVLCDHQAVVRHYSDADADHMLGEVVSLFRLIK